MHLLVPFASTLAEGGVHTLRDLQLPALSRLLARLPPCDRRGTDETSLTPPHERALAAALGWQGGDGCLPWAARLAAQDGVDGLGEQPWGLLTPVHWTVSAEGVALVDPAALALDEAESRALFETVRPQFESEGWRVAWGAPLRWYASHETLRDLPCAALDRVIGRSVDDWLRPGPGMALVRRLQSEAQMLLYQAPVNDAREARGALAVNTFWLSGCGVRQPDPPGLALEVDDSLRAPALNEDWAAWAEAWRALDAGPLAELLRHADRGAAVTLTLCGERHAQSLAPAASAGLWTRLTRGLRTPATAPLLEAL